MKELLDYIYSKAPILDAKLSEQGIPINIRPLYAYAEIRKEHPLVGTKHYTTETAILNIADPVLEAIKEWYTGKYEQEKLNETLYKAAFYKDNHFFSVKIPFYSIDSHQQVPMSYLELPTSIKLSNEKTSEYMHFFSYYIDYIRGYQQYIQKEESTSLAIDLLKSANIHLSDATNALTSGLDDTHSQQFLRFSTEINLKSYINRHNTNANLKNFGHDLQSLVNKCYDISQENIAISYLYKNKTINDKFPSIDGRYSAKKASRSDTWNMYKLSILVASSIVHEFVKNPFQNIVNSQYEMSIQEYLTFVE